jgi:hypothetical protein
MARTTIYFFFFFAAVFFMAAGLALDLLAVLDLVFGLAFFAAFTAVFLAAAGLAFFAALDLFLAGFLAADFIFSGSGVIAGWGMEGAGAVGGVRGAGCSSAGCGVEPGSGGLPACSSAAT